jgi:hypothetical protein
MLSLHLDAVRPDPEHCPALEEHRLLLALAPLRVGGMRGLSQLGPRWRWLRALMAPVQGVAAAPHQASNNPAAAAARGSQVPAGAARFTDPCCPPPRPAPPGPQVRLDQDVLAFLKAFFGAAAAAVAAAGPAAGPGGGGGGGEEGGEGGGALAPDYAPFFQKVEVRGRAAPG